MGRIMQRLAGAAIALAALIATPAAAEWREAKSAHFIVVSEGSERDLIRMSRQLEAVHWLMGLSTRAQSEENGLTQFVLLNYTRFPCFFPRKLLLASQLLRNGPVSLFANFQLIFLRSPY